MRRRAFLASGAALAVARCAPRPVLEYDHGVFIARGWQGAEPTQGWGAVLSVYAGASDSPAMLGSYRRRGGTVEFTPRFAPAPGLTMRAVYRKPGGPPIEKTFTQPAVGPAPVPEVTAISPAAEVLPQNLLRLYIGFSQPMARGQAYAHLTIRNAAGEVVANPFVEIDQELWDPAGTRLTVLFDPGRIKRGVKPNRDVGAPLLVGQRYTLVVGKGWPSAAGAALPADATKTFTVGPSERRPIALADWQVTAPRAGSREPLVVAFDRPLDAALLADCLHVEKNGETVIGKGAVENQARTWIFTPDRDWTPATYDLLVETRLEDLAGNRIGRAFDVDMVANPQPRIVKTVERLTFSVG